MISKTLKVVEFEIWHLSIYFILEIFFSTQKHVPISYHQYSNMLSWKSRFIEENLKMIVVLSLQVKLYLVVIVFELNRK